ncbi:MAG: hypothetical protein HYU63_03495 [Armatimonadetes bacterium]|nr:hypothetical protein [Armatimonadota bacterium]
MKGRIFLAENEFFPEQIPKYSLILKHYEKLNPQENLADFLKIAFEYFPGEYYLLNISAHGNGYKSLGFLNKNFLFELKKILKTEKEKIDILGFDACLMGMTEIAYEFKDLMNPPGILIASPESSAAEGWPYREIIKFLKNHPDLNPLQLSENILTQYIKFYTIKGYQNEIMAVLNLYYMRELAEKMESFSQEILRIYKIYKPDIKNIRKNSLTYYEPNFIDLADFANKIILADLNPSITKRALDLKETINKVVLLKGYTGGKIKESGGISIFFPMVNSKEKTWEDLSENSYQDLTFLSQGASPSWYNFIKEFNK